MERERGRAYVHVEVIRDSTSAKALQLTTTTLYLISLWGNVALVLLLRAFSYGQLTGKTKRYHQSVGCCSIVYTTSVDNTFISLYMYYWRHVCYVNWCVVSVTVQAHIVAIFQQCIILVYCALQLYIRQLGNLGSSVIIANRHSTIADGDFGDFGERVDNSVPIL